jgi:hypothetical protein
MKIPQENSNKLSKENILKLHLEEYKLRYANFWGIINRFGFAILIISIIPYIKPDIISYLKKIVIIFPIISLLLTIACAWLLAAEYQRQRMLYKRYIYLLTRRNRPIKMPRKTRIQRLISKPIGPTIIIVFLTGFTLISIANFFILLFRYSEIMTK